MLFATTLTSLDDKFSKKWESGAALPNDRINAIQKFYEKGILLGFRLNPLLMWMQALR
jgi:DNA repair photolyase